ncbi:amino acid ABC transporter permease [Leuconostoc palmae]|uniref:amino acid ABC transporter permease n=1 Tax=Leuconostoc palmae TaxID=501487 RepID=UPI001C7DCD4F|nr:amino acid ABC transporter permease [Leuconostoc palmae]
MIEFLQITIEYLPEILKAALVYTIPLTIISFVLAIIFATITAIIRVVPMPYLPSWAHLMMHTIKIFANFYVWIFRSTPMIVQLFIVFYGLPNAHITIFSNAWVAAITVFSLNTGAYASESIRAAILSVSSGQSEAGLSLGMSIGQVYRYIVIPQAARMSIPPLSNSLISLLKDTSLASVITIVEMFYLSQQIAAANYHVLDLYILVALVYAFMTSMLSFGQRYLEKYTTKYRN